MSKIWIDLTDIEKWHGHHGGTQRVVYGIANSYFLDKNNKSELGFFSYSAHNNKFYETSFEPIHDRVEAAKTRSGNINSVGLTSVSLKVKVKRKIKKYVPEAIKKNEAARQAASSALIQVSRNVQRVRNKAGAISNLRASNSISSGKEVVFRQDDVVLMLGKPWDDLNIQKLLTRQKKTINFKLVQVVYDLIIPLHPHLHHPTLFHSYTQHMFEAIQASDLLLPISKSTEKDLALFCERLGLTMPPTEVIRLGDDIAPKEIIDNATKPDECIEKKFILSVGTIEIRKNHMLLYYVYKLAQEKGIELPQLVIVGSRGWLTGDFQHLIASDPSLKDKIVILDNIDDNALAWAYSNCLFTVYPSMYEGWGLPIAESLAYGKVCLSSNTSSMPEVGRTCSDYFSPYSSEECLNKIKEYVSTDAVIKNKETQIRSEYKVTAWSSAYSQVDRAVKKLN